MPLILNKSIPEIAIWKIEESEHLLLHQLKDYSWIYDFLEQISHPEKRIEYLASRVLVKELCLKIGIKFDGIFKDEHHKPYLVGNNVHISISHSSKYCVAIYDKNNPIGIDIQAIDLKLQLVAKKFLTSLEYISYNKSTEMLCRAWCAKEAAYKMIGKKGVSLRNQIKLTELTENYATIQADFENKKYTTNVYFYTFDGYIIGYTE